MLLSKDARQEDLRICTLRQFKHQINKKAHGGWVARGRKYAHIHMHTNMFRPPTILSKESQVWAEPMTNDAGKKQPKKPTSFSEL